MKFESNWKDKTLESLEKRVWPSLDNDEGSHLVKTCNSLRKKQLKDFSVGDLRIMIGQNIGLEFLIPLALDVLKDNILAEGDFYEGDLLKNVLTSDRKYWEKSTEYWRTVTELFETNEQTLKDFDTTWEIKKGWFDEYKIFKTFGQ
jgi:hypothetical protein